MKKQSLKKLPPELDEAEHNLNRAMGRGEDSEYIAELKRKRDLLQKMYGIVD